jgi:tRNA-2-methylthio-N6-dimethylallyladenosine synthase
MVDFFMGKSAYIHTFGCQMNVHDSEKMTGILEEQGYSRANSPADADLVIFNTCSIRQKAEQKFYSELGRMKSLKKKRPLMKIVVAGCIAQQEGKNIFKHAPHVDFVIGTQNIHTLKNISSSTFERVAVQANPDIATTELPIKRNDGIRAWITIMYGCDNFCSYCVVPYTRGREQSRPSEHIYAEVSELAGNGYKEITLLGQNVNSYFSDTDFPGLLRKLDGLGGIGRIRFVTSHPKDLSDDLIRAMSELPSVCSHIHLPLQSGSSTVLRRMNRKYSFSDYLNKISCLRKQIPGIAITTDIIAGFPGETDRDHHRTIHALKQIEFDGIFAFKYSPRPFTKAAEMNGHVEESLKSDRLNEILTLQDGITLQKNKALVGTVQEILIEGESETNSEKLTGRTRSNKIVTIPKACSRKGAVVCVEITRSRKHSLEGTLVNS